MKVLWFTNTASQASEVLKTQYNGGGWIFSLEKQLAKVKTLELAVAFHHGFGTKQSFEIGTVKYFSIPFKLKKTRIQKLWSRWVNPIETDLCIDDYLQVVDEFKPDIIHIFGTEQAYGLIIPHLKVPAIIQIQGNLTIYSKKWFSGLSFHSILRYTNPRKLLMGHSCFHDYFSYSKRAIREQEIFRCCKYFIGRTDWDRRITKALSVNSTYFHCDELLREQFYHLRWSDPANEKIILFSTLKANTYKGIETILETAAILKKQRIFQFEWQVAGVGGTEDIVRIIEKAYKLKFIEHHIVFKADLNAEALSTSLLRADCFIHPSHIDNSPNSVCEAMLLGMPIIATYAGGIPSIIKDKNDGILVQDGDPYALAGAIIELARNRDYANQLGANARIRALVRHDHSKIEQDVLSIYSKVVTKNSISQVEMLNT